MCRPGDPDTVCRREGWSPTAIDSASTPSSLRSPVVGPPPGLIIGPPRAGGDGPGVIDEMDRGPPGTGSAVPVLTRGHVVGVAGTSGPTGRVPGPSPGPSGPGRVGTMTPRTDADEGRSGARRIGMLTAVAVVAAILGVVLALTAVQLSGRWSDGDTGGTSGSGAMMLAASDGEEGYLRTMIPHHQEAVVAARQLSRSDRAPMRALGRSIVRSQSAQVTDMRSWLTRWYDDAGPTPYEHLMDPLGDLRGDDLDRVFLVDMVGHHMAAVMASRRLLASGAAVHDETEDLARTVLDDQRGEIVRMRGWLADWFGVRGMGTGAMSDGHGMGGPHHGAGPR